MIKNYRSLYLNFQYFVYKLLKESCIHRKLIIALIRMGNWYSNIINTEQLKILISLFIATYKIQILINFNEWTEKNFFVQSWPKLVCQV